MAASGRATRLQDLDRLLRRRGDGRAVVLTVVLVVLVYLVAGWSAMTRLGDSGAADSAAFRQYADTLRIEGRLPDKGENYEYSLPPGLPLLGAYVDRLVARAAFDPGQPLAPVPSPLRRGAWLVLATLSLAAILLAGRRSRAFWAGLAGCALAALWAAAVTLSFVSWQPWSADDLLTLLCTTGVVVMAALLARETWPERPYAPALAAAATAAIPAVLRIGLVFHPDPLFALLSSAALVLALRASRRGWSPLLGIAAGALLGSAALVRQSAPVVMVAVGAAALLLGRRRAVGFVVVTALATLVVAGPWWGYQTSRFGNPIQSNLDRPGYMLDRQPLSFFVSFPFPDLVTHPYREAFRNELFPKFHADLWSDWFGLTHDWASATRTEKVSASSMSVLGFGGDALVLGGLVGFGIPALRRSLRGATAASAETGGLAAATVLFLLGWLGYVFTLVRFPQADGDPIQAHYLLFLAPAASLFALAAGRWAWRRAALTRWALVGWLSLYAVGYAALLVTSIG